MLGLCCFDQRDPVLYLLMLSEKDEYSSPRAFSICTSATLNFDCTHAKCSATASFYQRQLRLIPLLINMRYYNSVCLDVGGKIFLNKLIFVHIENRIVTVL